MLSPVAVATFPGENGKIAFSRDGDIWIMDPDGSNQEQITSGPAQDLSPKWAPDGSAIAFSRQTEEHNWVFIYDLTQGVNRLGNLENVGGPAWSPTGRKIVLTQTDPTFDPDIVAPRLVVVAVDGSNARRIPKTGGPATAPDWSPLGDRIAYAVGDVVSSIATIEPKGADQLFVSPEPVDIEVRSVEPSWSPDAHWIAFAYNPDLTCTEVEPGQSI